MSSTGNNASGWSCKLREHSSAAICTLWFPPTWAKRIPERFCCRFVGRMRNSLLWKCIVHSSSNDQTAILSSMIWLDHHSFLLSFLLAFFLFFFLSFFLSFVHASANKTKEKIWSVVLHFSPFGKRTRKLAIITGAPGF
jgi:hypothetical protein